jgi:glutathione S-transferase
VSRTWRWTTPRCVSSASRVESTFAETGGMSIRSSLNRRGPTRKHQITLGAQAPAITAIHSVSMQGSGGAGLLLRRTLSDIRVTRFPRGNPILTAISWLLLVITYLKDIMYAPTTNNEDKPHMKLYYKPGACSMASHIVLNELGIPFSLERTDTSQGVTETGRNYTEINPSGYVPALELESGRVLTENPAILEYLADLVIEKGLAPQKDTFERTRLRELLAFLSSELHKAFSPFFTGRELPAEERIAAEAKIAKRIAPLEARLSQTGSYLLGSQFSVADAYAFVILNWSQFIGLSLIPWPCTYAFWQKLRSHPSVVKALVTEGLLPARESQ